MIAWAYDDLLKMISCPVSKRMGNIAFVAKIA